MAKDNWDIIDSEGSEESKHFSRVLSQVLNGGFLQLWANEDSDGATYKARSSITFVNKYSKRYSKIWSSLMYDFISIVRRYPEPHEEDSESRDEKLDALDTKVYKIDDKLLADLAKHIKGKK